MLLWNAPGFGTRAYLLGAPLEICSRPAFCSRAPTLQHMRTDNSPVPKSTRVLLEAQLTSLNLVPEVTRDRSGTSASGLAC